MECINPIFIRETKQLVRCGKCLPCKENYQLQWSGRLAVELKNSFTAYFVTLTYSTENLPDYRVIETPEDIDRLPEFDTETRNRIAKRDLSLFLKDLRNDLSLGMPKYYSGKKVSQIASKGQNLRYFAVGELGTKKSRFHWHILFFNIPLEFDSLDIWLQFRWKMGFYHIGHVTSASIDYVTDYMFKNDREVIRLMSKGIGADYLSSAMNRHHKTLLKTQMQINGSRYPLSRYYSDKIFSLREKDAIKDLKSRFLVEHNLNHPIDKQNRYNTLKNKLNHKSTKK